MFNFVSAEPLLDRLTLPGMAIGLDWSKVFVLAALRDVEAEAGHWHRGRS
jgi:hypothetical protein